MPRISNFTEAQDALRPYYNNAQTKYTLDVMHSLMEYLGNPQNKLKVLHVAGTSGKTSTAYYLAALLKESGKNVGLSVSPHVDTVNERLQINGQPLPEAEFCRVLSEFIELVDASGIKPSYFELLVAMTYWDFARRNLDYVVIEVGLGGLLDGTNVVTREDKLCIITDIGMDHTEILGKTLSEIATQKSGIIQKQNHVFMYHQGEEVDQTVSIAVNGQGATMHWLMDDSAATQYQHLPAFQQRNLGLAVQAVQFALQRDDNRSLADDAIERATQITIPARQETFVINDKTIIIDGSHNQQKIGALVQSIQELYPAHDIAVLTAFVSGRGERWRGGLQELLAAAQYIIFTSFRGEQDLPKSSVDPEQLQAFAQQHNFQKTSVIAEPEEALRVLLARPEPILLVTGSFYLLNHIRPRIKELL